MPTTKRKKGFSLLEVMLAIGLFSMLVTAFAEAIIIGQQNTALSGARMRAALIAEEGLEAVRNMRDQDFTNLVDGSHGLTIANNQWSFSGTQDATDVFTRQVTITSVDPNTKNVVSAVTWQQNPGRTGSIDLTTHLTNWHHIVDQAVYLVLDYSNAQWSGSSNGNLTGLTLQNTAPFPIIIDKIIVSWTTPNQNLKKIIIGGITVYDGSISAGSTIDITDFTLAPGNTYAVDMAQFDGNMKNSAFVVTFIMKDSTGSLTTTFFPPCYKNNGDPC